MESGKKSACGLYPLVLEPIFKYRIWGGRRLEKMLGKKLPAGEPIGESWEVSCRNGDNNVIRNGELAGSTLADVFKTNREALVGPSLFDRSKFPLLNKFIDANDLLSVQVHPDEKAAAQIAEAEAKTEAWYVIHADPRTTLVKGLKPGVTKEMFENAVHTDSIPTLLNSFSVSAGDMIFVPAGCVHAMGKGLVICEIQQNSDTTYRVYDWGRVGTDGKPRQLHVEQALQAINFEDRSPDRVPPVKVAEGANGRTYLIASPYFAAQMLTLVEPTKESAGKKRFESLMMVEGAAAIRAGDGGETRVSTGDSVLIPACISDYAIVPLGRCVLLRIFVPDDIEQEIVQRLRSEGIAEESIRGIVFE
ncbi:MAG: class I mannose-6-phosphate isomerase [Candidatus Hydrogenedentota bacterium]|nr:MAG: class I mannose-6-phosphate isomerase [Candidatus Hydrogenedentota bacterium]